MTLQTEVAIVGGGLIGCMTAYYLRKRGRRVVVLERGVVGGESSGVSFGSLRLQGQHGDDLALALRAQEIWQGVEAELGESLEFVQQGHVHLALTEEHLHRLDQNAAALTAAGLPPLLLDGPEARRRWPFLGGAVRGASFSARDAVVNPRLVAPAFARAAARLGVPVRERAEVTAIERANGRFVLHGGYGTVTSEILVNAAGVWGRRLAAWFGEDIPCFAAGPAEMVTEPIPAFLDPVMHVVDGSVIFRQTPSGNLVIGGHPRMPVDAETRRARVPAAKLTTNLTRLVAVVPRMSAYHVIRSWTGIEGYLPDMMPVVGPSATTPGLFHACAFSGHGLQLGPAIATALAELIVDGGTDMPIAALGIGRLPRAEAVGTLQEEFQGGVLQV